MPYNNSQVNPSQPNQPNLNANQSAAALAFATRLSEQTFQQMNPTQVASPNSQNAGSPPNNDLQQEINDMKSQITNIAEVIKAAIQGNTNGQG